GAACATSRAPSSTTCAKASTSASASTTPTSGKPAAAARASAWASPAEGIMASNPSQIDELVRGTYKHGFFTDIEADTLAPGLNEDVIRLISSKKNEPDWLLEWRLAAYRKWVAMEEPRWAHVRYEPIDYQAISYYSAPRARKDGPKSL